MSYLFEKWLIQLSKMPKNKRAKIIKTVQQVVVPPYQIVHRQAIRLARYTVLPIKGGI